MSGRFGPLYHRNVYGKIYAQPLYVSNVWMPNWGRSFNVIYVATLENVIYAFDADNLDTSPYTRWLWRRFGAWDFDRPANNFLVTTGTNTNFGNGTDPHIGILSTPVIDSGTNTMYLVDAKWEGDRSKSFWLHALDIASGADRMPAVMIGGSVPATGGTLAFDPNAHLNRPGLLLANGMVYVAFGGGVDQGNYHGWVFAHRADTLAPALAYSTTSGVRHGGGIWQSGNGLAADERGNVFFLTGNGMSPDTARSVPERQENSFVKLDGRSLGVSHQYWAHQAVNEFNRMEQSDTDLGSGGALLVPGQDAVIGGGKSGKLYTLDRALAEKQAPFQAFTNQWPAYATTPVDCYLDNCGDAAPNIHGSPVYWATSDARYSRVYAWSEKDSLKAFSFDRATLTLNPNPVAVTRYRSLVDSMPGGILSISANGTTAHSGIVWAIVEDPLAPCTAPPIEGGMSIPNCNAETYTASGRLFAFDAETLAVLYNVNVPLYSKFTPPTVANGKVVLATSNNEIVVYGLQ
jgi:hypothetical protein